jgi:hypothetical protein
MVLKEFLDRGNAARVVPYHMLLSSSLGGLWPNMTITLGEELLLPRRMTDGQIKVDPND